MKKKDLEKKLKQNGYSLVHGGNHDHWIKKKCETLRVPRHKEINENLAKGILKKAGIK